METHQSPDGWPHHAWFRRSRRRLPMAAEVPASIGGRRAWVSVQPDGEGFRVSYLEVPSERYEELLRTWDYDAPGLLLAQERLRVQGEEELRSVLHRWLKDLSELRNPETAGWPL